MDSLSAEPPGSPVFVRMTIIKRQKKKKNRTAIVVVQSLSLVQLFVTPMNSSMLGFLDLHYLPEFAQTHVQ